MYGNLAFGTIDRDEVHLAVARGVME